VLSGLTTTGRIRGKKCEDCGHYTVHAREYYKMRELHTSIKPTDITELEHGDLTPERENIYRDLILKGGKLKVVLNYKI
jgi:hypothetical protein